MKRAARRIALSILLFFIGVAALPSSAQTLADTLRERGIPIGVPPVENATIRITSFAELNDPADYLIAYYIDDGSGMLKPPLYIARYTKGSRVWRTAALASATSSFHSMPVDCLGSALEFRRVEEYFLIHTHINPSAGCALVLNNDLSLKKALYGWLLAAFRSGLLVYHKSEVHFADTHPMEIAIYDPVSGKDTQIYPPDSDAIRLEYEEKLKKLLPSKDWCREHDLSCDPAQFSSELDGKVVLSEEMHSVTFVAEFDPYGVLPTEVADQPPGLFDKAVYVYRLGPGPIRHCEFWFDDLKDRYGLKSVDELLTPSMLDRLFAPSGR